MISSTSAYLILIAANVLLSKRKSFPRHNKPNAEYTVVPFTLRYYVTFKVRKCESFFYKINTCLQKNYHLHWIAGRANIVSKYIIIFQFWVWLLGLLSHVISKTSASCCKKILNYFLLHYTSIFKSSKSASRIFKAFL